MASRSWNRVELIGNLTRDPELRFTPSGAAVCTFGLATNRTYVTEGERREEVDFHRLVSWNKLAELCNQLLKKGNKVFISGRLQTRQWEAQDGTQRNVTEIVIEDMILLTPKAAGDYTQTEEVPIPVEVKEPSLKDGEPLAEKELASPAAPPPKPGSVGDKASEGKQSLPSDEGKQSLRSDGLKEDKEEKKPSAKQPPVEELKEEDLPF